MPSPMTRGPLPARVYWVRRIMVLGTALLLVVAIAHLLGNGSDASDGDGTAAQSAAETTPSTTTDPSLGTSTSPKPGKKSRKPGKNASTSQAPVLAEPEGSCAGSDIAVAPKVDHAVAGRNVLVVLQMRTMQSPACTFAVSSQTVTLSITSGKDAIWSSQQCPHAIPRRSVVLRNNATTKVGIVWNSKRSSEEECWRFTDWAMPGWYHVTAAALAGEPADTQFELTTPIAGTITKTATPSNSPSGSASGSPSGAVEPD